MIKENEKRMGDLAFKSWQQQDEQVQVFYKYQRITDYSLDALANNYIYLSSPEQLNDPFDPFIRIFKYEDSEFIQILKQKEPRIFCVTTDPLNVYMWSAYGGGGYGMCIGYIFFTGGLSLLHRVRYTDEVPKRLNWIELYTLKSIEWEHEEEHRIVMSGCEQKQYGLTVPVKIFLGSKVGHEDAMRVKDAMPSTVQELDILRPVIDKGKFGLAQYSVQKIIDKYGILPTPEQFYMNLKTVRAIDNGERININTCTKQQLMAFDVITPELAEKIISFRERHGYIHDIKILGQVTGFTTAIYYRIKDMIVTRDEEIN
jgi:DNA uptake protein ComE-like DNA-binding protein